MKVLEKAKMPDGIEIQLEDWSNKNTSDFPNMYGLMIGAYPIAQRSSKSGWVKEGDEFRLSIGYNRYAGYSNDDVIADYEALKSGRKRIRDLSAHFNNGERDKWLLGMESVYNESKGL